MNLSVRIREKMNDVSQDLAQKKRSESKQKKVTISWWLDTPLLEKQEHTA